MRIGVYFTAVKTQGGVYQYCVSILEALNRVKSHSYVVLNESGDVPEKFRNERKFEIVDLNKGRFDFFRFFYVAIGIIETYIIKPLYNFKWHTLIRLLLIIKNYRLVRKVNSSNLDLVIYPTATSVSFLASVPAIVTIYDLEHKIKPQFPEVSANGRWEEREYIYTNIVKSAFRLFVDSEIGKEDLLNCYQVDEEKIVILPYLPADYLNPNISRTKVQQIKKKLSLPEKYIFYPAKFWSHKNHINLIKAINVLKKRGTTINLLLTGSTNAEYSTYSAVNELIKKNRLENQIRHLGYLNYNELSAVYKLSLAMVMPTFFGPTNLPVLESWIMGTPVITSDIRGCRDQLSGAGLLVNPWKSEDIAKKILKIYQNDKLRIKLINLGKVESRKWNQGNFSKRLKNTIEDFLDSKKVKSKYPL